jgi:hypothetical protein
LTGSNQTQDYVSNRRNASHLGRLMVTLVLAAVPVVAMVGCGTSTKADTGDVKREGVITALDGSYSDYAVAEKCFSDLDSVALLAAEQGEPFTFFAYDGDPLSDRGVSIDFGEMEVPNRYEGTELEDDRRVEQAAPILNETHELAAKVPEIGETPIVGVLTRIARIADGAEFVPEYVVNCGDGIWTDLKPGMDGAEVRSLAAEIKPSLKDLKIDFIGLGASKPGSGPWVEELRSPVEQLLNYAGAELGVYDIELPAGWPGS